MLRFGRQNDDRSFPRWEEVPMTRRLPIFLSLALAAMVGLFALTTVLS